MLIEKMPLSAIRVFLLGPRRDVKPGDPFYARIKCSPGEFGLVEPLVWNERTGNLVGGHWRLYALIGGRISETLVCVVDLCLMNEIFLHVHLNKAKGGWSREKLEKLIDRVSSFPDFEIKYRKTRRSALSGSRQV